MSLDPPAAEVHGPHERADEGSRDADISPVLPVDAAVVRRNEHVYENNPVYRPEQFVHEVHVVETNGVIITDAPGAPHGAEMEEVRCECVMVPVDASALSKLNSWRLPKLIKIK